MRLAILGAVALGGVVWAQAQAPAQAPAQPSAQAQHITRGSFSFAYDERGISLLRHPDDPFGATVTTPAPAGRGGGGRGGAAQGPPPRAATLGLTIAYQMGGDSDWTTVATRGAMTAAPEIGTVRYSTSGTGPLAVTETYATDGTALDWTIGSWTIPFRVDNSPKRA